MFGFVAEGIAVGVARQRIGLYWSRVLAASKETRDNAREDDEHGRCKAERTTGEIRDMIKEEG